MWDTHCFSCVIYEKKMIILGLNSIQTRRKFNWRLTKFKKINSRSTRDQETKIQTRLKNNLIFYLIKTDSNSNVWIDSN